MSPNVPGSLDIFISKLDFGCNIFLEKGSSGPGNGLAVGAAGNVHRPGYFDSGLFLPNTGCRTPRGEGRAALAMLVGWTGYVPKRFRHDSARNRDRPAWVYFSSFRNSENAVLDVLYIWMGHFVVWWLPPKREELA